MGTQDDIYLSFADWALGSIKVDLQQEISPLLGSQGIKSIWINSFGSVSYSEMPGVGNLKEATDNVILAPFMVESASGEVWYRQISVEDIGTLSMITDDINNDEPVTFAIIITWANLKSTITEEINSAQLVIATTSSKTFVLFNYNEPISWTSAAARGSGEYHAAAGIFATGEA